MTDAAAPPEIVATRAGARSTLIISAAAGMTAASFNVWYPFLPLYAIDLGAKSDADAVFWVAIAIAVQGVTRLASSTIWGVLSDRFGRKLMLVRSLLLASVTFAVAALASEPWHLAVALGCQGFFSGFIPASVALVSVSVPESKLNSSLSMVTGAQYLGSTTGPAIGAALALAFGYRGSIGVAAMIPLIAGMAVLLLVPRDQVRRRIADDGSKITLKPFRWTRQFVLAIMSLFVVYSINELVRLATPISLREITGNAKVTGEAGLTFSLAGLTSAASVLLLSPRLFRKGRIRLGFALICGLGALGFVILASAGVVPVYIAGFLIVAMVISSMVPALNTHVAASVTRARRGTGFGIAASVQAFSFGVGPLGAAYFASGSLQVGFVMIACLFVALGAALFSFLRELQERTA